MLNLYCFGNKELLNNIVISVGSHDIKLYEWSKLSQLIKEKEDMRTP